MTSIRRLCLATLAAVTLVLTACDHKSTERKVLNVTTLTPRLQPVFEKTKTVCFGRFLVDVPASATVAWGEANIPLGVSVYHDGVDEVKKQAEKFIDELKSKKAIYHDHVPLLLSVSDVVQPEGRMIVGYEDFEAVNGLKIRGYFRLKNDGVVIDARPLRSDKDETQALINSIASRLRQRAENEVPAEPGNCIEYAFLPDKSTADENRNWEHIRIGFRLKEFPDAHFSIYVAPSNPHDPEGDSLEAQFKRMESGTSREEKKMFEITKFLRRSPRGIHEWQTGYEVLMRAPDEEGSLSHHDFLMKFTGVPNDPFKPYADIQFQTGVADDAAGATKASLTDEEAIAVWDKITSTIRVRPTSASPVKTAGANSPPHFPLGELAATGRTCPQTGWWQATESGNVEGGGRQHIKAGDRMPHVVSQGEPSMWQKLKGERPTYRTATVWKLVSYEEAPARTDATAPARTIAQSSPDNVAGNDETPPQEKG
jgi:hypothetical protein